MEYQFEDQFNVDHVEEITDTNIYSASEVQQEKVKTCTEQHRKSVITLTEEKKIMKICGNKWMLRDNLNDKNIEWNVLNPWNKVWENSWKKQPNKRSSKGN